MNWNIEVKEADMIHPDAVAASIAGKATYSTAAATFVAGLTMGELASFIGIVATVVALIANIYFKIKTDVREQREHESRMKHLQEDDHHG